MIKEYINFKHENRVDKFLASVSVPKAFLHYDNVTEYSQAKLLLKGTQLNPTDRKALNDFVLKWASAHGNVEETHLKTIRKKLTYYNNKALNQKLREERLHRNAVKKIAKLKKTV